jgi:hypothetical protein
VTERDEKKAEENGGDPLVDIVDASTMGSGKYWVIGQMYPRDPALVEFLKLDKSRLKFLRWFFDGYNTNPKQPLFLDDFAESHGETAEKVEAAFIVLLNQELIRAYSPGGAFITPKGYTLVEQSLRFPGQTMSEITMHMNQFNNHISGGNIGNMQQGQGHSAISNQQIGVGASEIAHLLHSLRETARQLPEQAKQNADELIEAIEEEGQREKPRKAILGPLIESLPDVLKAAPAFAELAKMLLG